MGISVMETGNTSFGLPVAFFLCLFLVLVIPSAVVLSGRCIKINTDYFSLNDLCVSYIHGSVVCVHLFRDVTLNLEARLLRLCL